MITLAWPWVLVALPLPLLVRWLARPARPQLGRALRLPFYRELALTGATGTQLTRWRQLLAWLIWLLLVFAAARPQWLGEPVQLPMAGRDLMLAVDLSGSMQTLDYRLQGRPVSRLDVVKAIAGQFIQQRVGDRVGLILFGSRAYLQTPLTYDRKTVREMLDQAVIGLAGRETAIGDAIALAVKRLRDQPQDNRVLILLTDGVNNAGDIAPLAAAKLAKQEGVRIYTIGIGGGQVGVNSPFGMLMQQDSNLDMQSLQQIANITGGRFFVASDAAELRKVYRTLDRLEPSVRYKRTFRPMQALYMWPAGAALLLSIGLAIAALPRRAREKGGAEVVDDAR